VILGLGWPLTFLISVALEPAPAHPEAATPILVELAGMAFFVALWATVIAAVQRHPMAATAAVVTGLLAVGFSITCPLSGHHGYGLWWVAQLGLTATMLAASAAALGRRARTDD
jgi:hypothetical protein